jgi:alpha-beta hydrolase superfamily lysophospholipase
LEHAHRLYQKAKEPKELAIIPGAKHKLRLEEKAVTAVLEWLKLNAKNKSSNDLVQIDE